VRPQSKDVRGLESLRSFGSVPPWRSALRSGQAPLTEIVHCAQTDVVSFQGRRKEGQPQKAIVIPSPVLSLTKDAARRKKGNRHPERSAKKKKKSSS
jgi:hypothetical protein